MGELEKIRELARLFAARQRATKNGTRDILKFLEPSILLGICQAINLKFEDVQWDDIELNEDVIVVSMIVSYTPDSMPSFLADHVPPSKVDMSDVESVEQLVKFGIPFEYAFSEPDEVCEFLIQTAKNAKPRSKSSLPPTPHTQKPAPSPHYDFSYETLTKQQINQLLLYQLSDKKTKH